MNNRIVPWANEPDLVSLEINGYHLLVRRNPMLHILLGYVGISRDHAYWGKHYDEIEGIDVHGGLTYSGNGLDGMKEEYWYLGFDCAHFGDYVPKLMPIIVTTDEQFEEIKAFSDAMNNFLNVLKEALGSDTDQNTMSEINVELYRDIEYTTKEVESLYLQLSKLHTKSNNRW